jgi:hypothetical protein
MGPLKSVSNPHELHLKREMKSEIGIHLLGEATNFDPFRCFRDKSRQNNNANRPQAN